MEGTDSDRQGKARTGRDRQRLKEADKDLHGLVCVDGQRLKGQTDTERDIQTLARTDKDWHEQTKFRQEHTKTGRNRQRLAGTGRDRWPSFYSDYDGQLSLGAAPV